MTDPQTATERFHVIPAAYVLLTRPAEDDDADGEALEALLSLRQGTGYMDGLWAFGAAGHVERGETVHAAAVREAAEELGVRIQETDLVPLTVMHRTGLSGEPLDERVDFFFSVSRWEGTPSVQEPEKSAALQWFRLDALPTQTVPHELKIMAGVRDWALEEITSFGFAPAEAQEQESAQEQAAAGRQEETHDPSHP